MPFQAEHLVECETCHAVQVIDLRDYKGKVVTCAQCGSPFDLEDFERVTHQPRTPSFQVSETPIVIKTVQIDVNGLRQMPVEVQQVFEHFQSDLNEMRQRALDRELVRRYQNRSGEARQTAVKKPSSSGGTCALIFFVAFIAVAIPLGISLQQGNFDWLTNAITGAKNPDPTQILYGHADRVAALAFSPDGRYLASGGADGTVRVWDRASGNTWVGTQPEYGVQDVAFSPDGVWFFAADSNAIYRWRVADFKLLPLNLEADYFSPRGLAISPDGRYLAIADGSQSAIYDTESGRRHVTLSTNSTPNDLIFTLDSQQLITLPSSGSPMIWDVEGGLMIKTLAVDTFAEALALSPDGQTLAFDGSSEIYLYDLPSGQISTLKKDFFSPEQIAFSPDGRYVAAGNFFGDVSIFEVSSGDLDYELEVDERIEALAFSPDGSTLAAGLSNGTVVIWELFPEKKQPFGVERTPTPFGPFCWVRTLATVQLAIDPLSGNHARTVSEGFRLEADGQRLVQGVTWWHLRDDTWVRSDLVEEEATCASLPNR